MNDRYTGYARFWMASSTLCLSLAVASVAWLACAFSLACLNVSSINSDGNILICSFISFVVICLMLVTFWKSKGFVKLHTLELMIGGTIIFIGTGYFITGVYYSGSQFLGGLGEILLGVYLGVAGLVLVIAGGLGLLAVRFSRERK